MEEKKAREIDLELDENIAQGVYSNLVIISHSTSEFVIDFAALMPGVPKAKVRSRIIITPEHTKRLLMTLQDNVTRYESNVGRIEIPMAHSDGDSPEETLSMGFNIGEA